ncbi:acyltransferase family protein [Novosphingobium sp.]|uniref:acyltransferase family protein n=1 Tax=Novosphingobium sp. TaxID=1874826 RepID=UPI003B519DE4
MKQRHATRLDALQVLRAVAALAVVVFHCHWTGVASFGVELFFVISGFVICHAAAQDPRHFLLKRIARVVPLYWLATLGVFALATVAPSLLSSTQVSGLNLVRSLVFWPYLRADGAWMPLLFLGWTLNYEAFFYVVFALCLGVSARLAPYLATAALVLIASLHGAAMHWPATWPLAFWTAPIVLNFACGIVAWLIWHTMKARLMRIPHGLATGIAIIAMGILATGANHGIGGPLPTGGIVSAVLLLALLGLGPRLRWPAGLLAIGDASYSLYLLHPYVLEVVNRKVHAFGPDVRGVLATLLGVGGALALALVMYRVVERPSNRIARRLIA